MEQSLSELPAEVLANIASRDPDVARRTALLSKYIRTSTGPEYSGLTCKQGIFLREIRTYLAEVQPQYLCHFDSDRKSKEGFNNIISGWFYIKDQNEYRSTSNLFLNKITNIQDLYYTTAAMFEEVYRQMKPRLDTRNLTKENTFVLQLIGSINRTSFAPEKVENIMKRLEGVEPYDSHDFHEVSFINQFGIYQRREGCVVRNSRYANDMILRQIMELINSAKINEAEVVLAVYTRLWFEWFTVNNGKTNGSTGQPIELPQTIFDLEGNPVAPLDLTPWRNEIQRLGSKLLGHFAGL